MTVQHCALVVFHALLLVDYVTTHSPVVLVLFFFFNDTATTEIYTLSLHDALPIWDPGDRPLRRGGVAGVPRHGGRGRTASRGWEGAVAHRHRAHRRTRADGRSPRPARGPRDRGTPGRVADGRADCAPVELCDPRDDPRRPQPQVLRRRHGRGRARARAALTGPEIGRAHV